MKLCWTKAALRDLAYLHAYIAQDNLTAADRFAERLREGISILPSQPHMGRMGRVARTRELIIPPFVVVYIVRRAEIAIVALIHSARRWPESF